MIQIASSASRILSFLFVPSSILSFTAKNLNIAFRSDPGFNLIICTLNGSMVWVSMNIDKCLSIRRETVLWCKRVRLDISLIQSQPPSAPFKHLTILITFSAASFLILYHSQTSCTQLAHLISLHIFCLGKEIFFLTLRHPKLNKFSSNATGLYPSMLINYTYQNKR